jgi:hypothetical protein
MRRCVADFGFFLLWRPAFGQSSIAAGFALAVVHQFDAKRS